MDIWSSMAGMIEAELTSADIPGMLSALSLSGITLQHCCVKNEFTARVLVHRKDYRKLVKKANKRGESVKVTGQSGIYWKIKRILCRPALIGGIGLLLMLACFLPTRVLFVQIEGNRTVPTNLILEKAAQAGISFGASRKDVRSEKMKNALLEAMPQLQWAGVNTNGCVAVITVREREFDETSQSGTGVSSIVSSCDGVILNCTATKGNLLCKPGQAVKKGQVLISGYTDCGIAIRATQAQGEVYARTRRGLQLLGLAEYCKKAEKKVIIKKYSIVIGKKRINLSNSSGILDTSCDKMYAESFLTLPGGWKLPFGFITETYLVYDTEEATKDQDELAQQLSAQAKSYLGELMIAGEILSCEESWDAADGVLTLSGSYSCREMIGRVQQEEIVTPDGKCNGT